MQKSHIIKKSNHTFRQIEKISSFWGNLPGQTHPNSTVSGIAPKNRVMKEALPNGNNFIPPTGNRTPWQENVAQRTGNESMDYTIEQAAQPSPIYLERAQQKGLLGKYYDDKVKQDYAINPDVGDTGQPARAIPVEDNSSVAATAPSIKYPDPKPQVDFNALFKKHHATAFDPNSRIDRIKMQKLQSKYK